MKSFLEESVELHKDRFSGADRQAIQTAFGEYFGMEDLVLRHGRLFTPSFLPKGVKPKALKRCFRNAYNLVRRRSDLIYVEGYAMMTVHPLPHAWCVDREGRVIDPTWNRNNLDRPLSALSSALIEEWVYFGIPFKREYVLKQWRTFKSEINSDCVMIDDWERRWPLFKTPVEEWKEIL